MTWMDVLWVLVGINLGVALCFLSDESDEYARTFVGEAAGVFVGVLSLPITIVVGSTSTLRIIAIALHRKLAFLLAGFFVFVLKSPKTMGWWFSIKPRVLFFGDAYVPREQYRDWKPSDSLSSRRKITAEMGRQLAEQTLAYSKENPKVPWHLCFVRVNEGGPRAWISKPRPM